MKNRLLQISLMILLGALQPISALANCDEAETLKPLPYQSVFNKSTSLASGVNILSGEVLLRPVDKNNPLGEFRGKHITVGTVLNLAGVFRKLEDANSEKYENVEKYSEVTLVGLVKVSVAQQSGPSPVHNCYEFTPVEKDMWPDYGLNSPSTEGTVVRILEDESSNYATTDLSTTLDTVQDGNLIYEFGYIANTLGQGVDARPATSSQTRPNFNFLFGSTLRIGANLTTGPLYYGTGLLPTGHTNPLFGSPTQAQISATNWNWVRANSIPGWKTAGDIKLSIRLVKD